MRDYLAKKWACTHSNLDRDNLPFYSGCSYIRNICTLSNNFYLQLGSYSFKKWFWVRHYSSFKWNLGVCSSFLRKRVGCFQRVAERMVLKRLSDGVGHTLLCRKVSFSIMQWALFLLLMASLGLCLLHDSNMRTVCYSSNATWHDYLRKE